MRRWSSRHPKHCGAQLTRRFSLTSSLRALRTGGLFERRPLNSLAPWQDGCVRLCTPSLVLACQILLMASYVHSLLRRMRLGPLGRPLDRLRCNCRPSTKGALRGCAALMGRGSGGLPPLDGAAATQVVQRFADTVRVQALVHSERTLCYQILLHALEVRAVGYLARKRLPQRGHTHDRDFVNHTAARFFPARRSLFASQRFLYIETSCTSTSQ